MEFSIKIGKYEVTKVVINPNQNIIIKQINTKEKLLPKNIEKQKEQKYNDNNFNNMNKITKQYNSFVLLSDETPIVETQGTDNNSIENILNNVKVSFDLEGFNNNLSSSQKILKEINSQKEEISQSIKELTKLSEKLVPIENDLIKEKITNCLNKYDQYHNLTEEKLNKEDTNFINLIKKRFQRLIKIGRYQILL